MKPFKVEIFVDVVCPWCYAGKRNIDSALDYYRRAYPDERHPEVVWMPFLLHASVPKEGFDRKEYLKRRFPGNANSPAMFVNVTQAGRAVGVEYRFDRIERQPSSVDAHRLIRHAQQHNVADPVIESLFKAFFVDGQDISRHEVLIDIATRAGLDTEAVAAYLASEVDVELIKTEDARAKGRGVTTVPFMVLNGRKGFSAIQKVDAIVGALKWARRDFARPSWWPSFLAR